MKLVALVAVEAFPLKLAVIVPARKLPLASLKTTADAVLALVGAIPLILVTVVAPCVPLTSPMSPPVKLVDVTAFPFKLAVIVPARKLPLASLNTTDDAVFVLAGAIPLILVTVVAP